MGISSKLSVETNQCVHKEIEVFLSLSCKPQSFLSMTTMIDTISTGFKPQINHETLQIPSQKCPQIELQQKPTQNSRFSNVVKTCF